MIGGLEGGRGRGQGQGAAVGGSEGRERRGPYALTPRHTLHRRFGQVCRLMQPDAREADELRMYDVLEGDRVRKRRISELADTEEESSREVRAT
jgi:hypothetical protein